MGQYMDLFVYYSIMPFAKGKVVKISQGQLFIFWTISHFAIILQYTNCMKGFIDAILFLMHVPGLNMAY